MKPTPFEELRLVVYECHLIKLAEVIGAFGLSDLDFVVQNIRLEIFAHESQYLKPIMMISYSELEKMLDTGFVEYASFDRVEPTSKMKLAVTDLMNYKRLREL